MAPTKTMPPAVVPGLVSTSLARRRALVALRVAFGLAWATDAILKWLPAFADSTFLGTLKGARAGQPQVVKDWINLWVGVFSTDPQLFAHLLAVAESLAALLLVLGAFTNLVCLLGSLLSLGIWTTAEGLGGPYVNGSTDISASIIYVMVFAALALTAAGGYLGVDARLRPRLGRLSWLCSPRCQPVTAGNPSWHRSWLRKKTRTVAGAVLVAGGIAAITAALISQHHAPSPSPAAFGSTGSYAKTTAGQGRRPSTSTTPKRAQAPTTTQPRPNISGPVLGRSRPVTISIPAIHVRSKIFDVGLNPDGTIQVPPLDGSPRTNEAAWYEHSPTPGQIGPSVIEGHIDSAADGPSVFYNLGALHPGNQVDVSRADGTVAVFTVTGVRKYLKTAFPTATVYGNTKFAALRLLTCGGSFDPATGHYLSNTVVFASLTSSHPAS